MEDRFEIIVEVSGERLDAYVASKTDFSRSYLKQQFAKNSILVNGEAVKNSYKVKEDDVITFNIVEEQIDLIAQDIPIDIVYEDEDLLIVNKQAGLVVHPGAGNKDNTLVNALLFHVKTLSSIDEFRPGIVHRIDKDTTGLLIVAKNNRAHELLSKMIADKTVTREYITLVEGTFDCINGTIDAPIARDSHYRQKMMITGKNSKHAITHFTVLDANRKYSLLRCRLETGRTHQIRIHLKYIEHPIVGDEVYGYRNTLKVKQLLHSYHLSFKHPISGKDIEVFADIPKHFREVLNEEGIKFEV